MPLTTSGAGPASLRLQDPEAGATAPIRPRILLGRAQSERVASPRVSPWMLHWFTAYSRRYLRRHFHSVRISRAGGPSEMSGRPLVLYANHASWWDALVCLVLKEEFFTSRKVFAPMDAAMLERYKFFRKLGFFGVEQGSPRGARQFLVTSENILRAPDALLVITPQSRFADVRARPARLQPGLGHLAARVEGACFVAVAVELVFWEERLPEILVRFGEPVTGLVHGRDPVDASSWTALFEQRLTQTQDALALEVQRRDPASFQTILRGGAGQGGIYDWWRAGQAWWRGSSFRKEHGKK